MMSSKSFCLSSLTALGLVVGWTQPAEACWLFGKCRKAPARVETYVVAPAAAFLPGVKASQLECKAPYYWMKCRDNRWYKDDSLPRRMCVHGRLEGQLCGRPRVIDQEAEAKADALEVGELILYPMIYSVSANKWRRAMTGEQNYVDGHLPIGYASGP